MSHHIDPKSVSSYLSGICQQLEPYFPNVRPSRHSPLVERTMKGCLRLKGSATKRKRALTTDDLSTIINDLSASVKHDDLLFMAMLLTRFFALMHLGELTFSNEIRLRNWKKIVKRSTVTVTNDQYEFHLPSHKADPFFEGNHVIVKKQQYCNLNPLHTFQNYLRSRDHKFPLSSPLWLTSSGSIPTRNFFITRLRRYFERDVAGQSMRAGGATYLAENGVPPSLIQFIGRWSSDAFFIYIRKSPVLIQALLYSSRPIWSYIFSILGLKFFRQISLYSFFLSLLALSFQETSRTISLLISSSPHIILHLFYKTKKKKKKKFY